MEQAVTGAPSTKAAKNGRADRLVKDGTVPRERILQAAARLFRTRGYKRTTVRDIADEVGILSGSLFHHFRTKEEMLLEIMREAALSICLRAEALIDPAASPSEQLRELIRLEIKSFTSEVHKDYHGVLFFEWREVPDAAKAEFTRLRKRYQRTWLAVLERCQAEGSLRCEPDAASLILHGALSNAMTWFAPSGRYSTEEFGDILMRLMLN
jgi:AcrR family transcriptional regulator